MKELDCRGLACPQPVLQTKDALDEIREGQITVIVDNDAAVGNVSRFAHSQGAEVTTAARGNDFVLTIVKKGQDLANTNQDHKAEQVKAEKARLVVKISSQYMGEGSEELGRVLMQAFLKTLAEATLKPKSIVFYNGGVHLTCDGSDHLESIKTLEEMGIEIYSCGTCLDFFNKKEQLAVGAVSNMFEIVDLLSGADRVVEP